MNPDNNQPLASHLNGNPALPHKLPPDYLRWLFIAEFDSGTQYAQTADDRADCDPHRDAFYDILYLTGQLDRKPEKVRSLTRFHLTDSRNWFTVDLRDGKFEVNGLPFEAHPQLTELEPPLNLIYYRESRADLFANGTTRQYVNRYFLGWWFMDKNGKKVEETIAIT